MKGLRKKQDNLNYSNLMTHENNMNDIIINNSNVVINTPPQFTTKAKAFQEDVEDWQT